MKTRSIASNLLLGTCLTICLGSAAAAQIQRLDAKSEQKVEVMKDTAKGTFDVKVVQLAAEENIGDATIGRLSLAKTFSGDLAGTSKGQMLGSQSEAVAGSGGYVAMERFTGTLKGKKGSFILQHIGTMQGGKFDLNVMVVPDSGTGELTGISGTFKIVIEDNKHFYEFEYSISAAKQADH